MVEKQKTNQVASNRYIATRVISLCSDSDSNRDVPIIGSAIGNGLYRLDFSNPLSDRLVNEISSRFDIIGGQ